MTRAFVSTAFALTLAWAAPLAAAAQSRDCAIDALEGGEAEIWRAGTWAPVAAGALAPGEAKLRTGPAARLEILCDDGLRVTVAPDTEVNLEALTGPAGRGRDVILQLLRGLIGIIAPERTWRRLETRTPLAIAAARTTEWLAEAPPNGAVGFFVREGRIGVRASGAGAFAPAELAAGEGITVAADGAAGPVVAWGRPRIDAARANLGLSWR